MATRLKKMRLKFVSLVDSGAGEGADIVLAKRYVEKSDPTGSDTHVDVPLGGEKKPADKRRKNPFTANALKHELIDGEEEGQDDEDKYDVYVEKNNRQARNRSTVISSALLTEEPSMGDNISKGDFSDLPSEVLDYIESLEDRVIQAESIQKRQAEEISQSDEPDESDIFKNADPAVREHFAKMQQRLEDAETIAFTERENRLEREYIDKAESLSGLAAPAVDIANILKATAEINPELSDEIESVLRSASIAVNESALFSEVGKRGNRGSTEGKVESVAKSLQSADPSLTTEQAFDAALLSNPNLYAQYLTEMEA